MGKRAAQVKDFESGRDSQGMSLKPLPAQRLGIYAHILNSGPIRSRSLRFFLMAAAKPIPFALRSD